MCKIVFGVRKPRQFDPRQFLYAAENIKSNISFSKLRLTGKELLICWTTCLIAGEKVRFNKNLFYICCLFKGCVRYIFTSLFLRSKGQHLSN